MNSASYEEGSGNCSRETGSFLSSFFPAPWVLFGPLLSDWALLRDGAEAGVWGQENESPPFRGTEGSPEMLAQCYKMLASCYENQAGIGSSWVASSGPPQPWASEADMEAMEAGSLQETRTSPS